MSIRAFLLLLGVIALVITIGAFIEWRKYKEETSAKLFSLIEIFLTTLMMLGSFVIGINPEIAVKVVVPDMQKIADESAKVKAKNDQLEAELKETEEKYESLKENTKYKIDFEDYKLYIDNILIPANSDNAFINVDNNFYFSQEIIESITGESVQSDKDKNILYIGRYPEETVDMLSVCDPYDSTYGFVLGADESFNIKSDIYSEGIVLEAKYYMTDSVKFNLRGKYSELTFNMDRIDGEPQMDSFFLKVIVDDEVVKTFTGKDNIDILNKQSIPLNYGKELAFEWGCGTEGTSIDTAYGVINMKLL